MPSPCAPVVRLASGRDALVRSCVRRTRCQTPHDEKEATDRDMMPCRASRRPAGTCAVQCNAAGARPADAPRNAAAGARAALVAEVCAASALHVVAAVSFLHPHGALGALLVVAPLRRALKRRLRALRRAVLAAHAAVPVRLPRHTRTRITASGLARLSLTCQCKRRRKNIAEAGGRTWQ